MGKKKTSSTPAKTGVLSPEEFQKLTPEEQLKYVADLQAKNEALATVAKEAKSVALPSVEIEEDDPSGVEAGTYNWTAPTFTWDDNTVIKVSDLMKDAASKDEKVSQNAQVIIANLLGRKSGLLVRKED